MKVLMRAHEIEAVKWTGKNYDELDHFTNGYVVRLRPKDDDLGEIMLTCGLFTRKVAKVGDWIVKDQDYLTVWDQPMMDRWTEGVKS